MARRFSVLAALLTLFAWTTQAQWATVYYAGWAKWNSTPVDIPQLDFSCGSHWIFFTMAPQGNGTFDGSGSGIDGSRHAEFVAAAHAAGAKALMGTGGWGADYTGVVTNQSVSVAFLVNLMNTYGYDGVDIDWEPVPSSQYANFSGFVKALKAAKPNMILTAACFNYDQAIVNNQDSFDQINLMTYDMSGAWTEVSWHNSATFPDGVRPSDQSPLPSIDGSVNAYINAGVPARKIGFGVEMYGYVWNGVTGPKQTGFGQIQNTVPYWQIMDTYESYGLKWDGVAQATYISAPGKFVSFDAETTLVSKAAYLRNKGLGGVIVYEAAAGYRASQSDPNRLLKTVKYAFLNGPALPPPPPPPPPPVIEKKNYTIYTDGALNSPFVNTSWGATAEFANTEHVRSGSSAVKVNYLDWGAFDINSGQWGSEIQLAADSLKFDFYPTSSFPLTVSFYSTTVVVNVAANQWNSVSIPCPQATFTRFYLQRNLSGTATAYVDNIRLVANGESTPPSIPAPPVLVSPANGATGVSAQPTFSWNASSGATTYHLQLSANSSFTPLVADSANVSATSCGSWMLSANSAYYWRVSAANSAGSSAYSSPSSFTTAPPPAPPAEPVLVSPANGATGVQQDVTLTWNSATGANSYRVQLSTSPDCNPTMCDTAGIAGTSFAPKGLSASTIYYWRVSATNSAGSSPFCTTYGFTTAAPPSPPASPALLSPADGAVNVAVNPLLSWNASQGAGSYRIQIDTTAAFAHPLADTAGLSSTSFAPRGLAGHTQYHWRVCASNSGGSSAFSTAFGFTTGSLPSDLIAAYSFSEGTGSSTDDASGHGVTGSIANAAWTTDGRYGDALTYNGSSSYIDLGNPQILRTSGSMTWSAWVKATANPADDGIIIGKADPSHFGWTLKTSPDNGPHTFCISISTPNNVYVGRYSSTVRRLNTWYYVAGVYNADAKTLDIYVNGVLDNGALAGTVPSSRNDVSDNVTIGRRVGGFFFAGVIDEVRLYNRALTQIEIQADMNSPVGVRPPSVPAIPVLASPADGATGVSKDARLVWNASSGATSYRVQVSSKEDFSETLLDSSGIAATSFAPHGLSSSATYLWRVSAADSLVASEFSSPFRFTTAGDTAGPIAAYSLNEGTGTATNDVSGHGLAGAISGASWTRQGKYGDALSFNGWNAYVSLGKPPTLSITGSMTWSAWVYATADPGDDGVIIGKADQSSFGWTLKTSPDNGLHNFCMSISTPGNVYVGRYSKTVRQLNTWYHVAGVYNASAKTLDIYVNGEPDDGLLAGTVPSSMSDPNVEVTIGRRGGGLYFIGTIDEVRLYDRALSQSEIQSDMNTPLAGQSLVIAGMDGSSDANGVPASYGLAQNYPNPFNPTTSIRFQLPAAGRVLLRVYDLLGRCVATLADGERPAGRYVVRFNGAGLSSGVYIYRLEAGSYAEQRKLLLLK